MQLTDVQFKRQTPETSWVYANSPHGLLSAGVTARRYGLDTACVQVNRLTVAEMVNGKWAILEPSVHLAAAEALHEILDALQSQAHVDLGAHRTQLTGER